MSDWQAASLLQSSGFPEEPLKKWEVVSDHVLRQLLLKSDETWFRTAW